MKNLPIKIVIKGKLDQVKTEINPNNDLWFWESSGKNYSFNWSKFNNKTKLILKLFLIDRFSKLSIETVSKGDIQFLKELYIFGLEIPFNDNKIFTFFIKTKDIRNIFTFRKLYQYGLNHFEHYFNLSSFFKIKEFKKSYRNPYERVFLQQNFVTKEESEKIRIKINSVSKNESSFIKLRNNIILQLSYELAPRPSQFYLINKSDFKIATGKTTSFYSINLTMSKKIKSQSIEKRNRSISAELGEKIQYFLKHKYFLINKSDSMFFDKKGKRLSSSKFTSIVKSELKTVDVNRTPTDLRHHLAQSLADQGASAEIIAEILGHNSTIPARAYIAATPKIADIKSAALAKNKKYNSINKMLIGDFSEALKTKAENNIKGLVGSQYVGGIGSCGLPNDTTCSKNPIYSCYTCVKFHPYKNKSQHSKVKLELQKQAQYFVDISESGNDIQFNRPITQLKSTIEAVQNVLNLIEFENE